MHLIRFIHLAKVHSFLFALLLIRPATSIYLDVTYFVEIAINLVSLQIGDQCTEYSPGLILLFISTEE